MNRLYFIFFTVLFAGCTGGVMDFPSGPSSDQWGFASSPVPIEFVLSYGSAGEVYGQHTKSDTAVRTYGSCLSVTSRPWPVIAPDTKVTPVTAANLDSLYVCTQYKPSGYVTVLNSLYRKGTDGVFSCSGQYWPNGVYDMTVWASNVPGGLYSGSSYNGQAFFDCPAGVDVIAGIRSVASGQQFALSMRHVYARIGSLSVQAPEGFVAQNISSGMECPVEGAYICGQQVFVTDGTETLTLSAGNDILVVPGTYDLTVTFDLTDGSTVQQGIVRTGSVTLDAGMINDITASLPDRYDYSLEVTPSPAEVNVGADVGLTATLTTSYGGSVLSVDDVTSSAVWTSLNPGIASVSAGTVRGVMPGTARIVAYDKVRDTVSVTVNDYITGYDNPVVTLSYSPSPIPASGGTAVASVSYSQTVHYASGAVSYLTSGGTVTWQQVTQCSGLSFNSSTGAVTASANGSEYSRTGRYRATVTVNGKSGSATVDLTQEAALIIHFDD